MKVSMKKIIRAMSIIMVVIVYITTIILSSSVLDTSNIFNKNNIIALIIFVAVAYICSVIVSNKIVLPLRKIEKGMRVVSEGKLPDVSRIKENEDFKAKFNRDIDEYINKIINQK